MRRDLALVGAFSGLRVELASGNHGRRTSSGSYADPCAEIRSTIGTRTGRRERGHGCRWRRWLGWWRRGAANAAVDAAKHVAAFVVMLAGAALVGTGANWFAAKAIRRADARSTWSRGRGAAEECIGPAGIFRASVAGAAAQRFIRIGAVADTIVAAFAFAAILIGLAGLAGLRGTIPGRVAGSDRWRHADSGIAGILANAAAEVGAAITGCGAADKAWATIPWPGWIFAGADTAHAASDAAAVIFFTACVARSDAERWRLAADRRIRANA